MLGVDESDKAAARAQDQLGLVLEQHLDDLVRVAEEDGLLGPLPLLYVDKMVSVRCLAHWSVLLREGELEGLELLIAIEVALEVLQEDHLLGDGVRVIEEIKLRHLVRYALSRLAVGVGRGLLPGPLNVIKVEQVGVENNFSAVIEEHSIRAVGKHVAKSILR